MRHGRTRRALLALPITSLLSLFLTGCGSGLPTQLENKLASDENAEDHMAAPIFYQKQAEQFESKPKRISLRKKVHGDLNA